MSVSVHVTPRGTRGGRMPTGGPMGWLFKQFNRYTIRRYKRAGSEGISSRMGFPVVLLTTKGAKSGLERTTPIGGFPDGENVWLVVASLAGAARHPAWFLNLAAHPDDVWLEVGKERFKVSCESVEGEERRLAMARVAAIAPRYGKYQEHTDREIPIVRLTRQG